VDFGSGYTSAPTIAIPPPFASGGLQARATTVFNGGKLSGFTVLKGGSDYNTTLITLTGVGGGSGAIAASSVRGNAVFSVKSLSNGSAYTQIPNATVGGAGTDAKILTIPFPTSVSAINLTNAGTGYDSHVTTLAAIGGGGDGAVLSCEVNSGRIVRVNVLSPGSGYTSDPEIVVTSATGSGASFSITRQGDGIGAISVTNSGSGYLSPPLVMISGSGGAEAVANVTASNVVTGLTVSDPGAGYLKPPIITISAPDTEGATVPKRTARAYAVMSAAGLVEAIVVQDGGAGYLAAPKVTVSAPHLAGVTTRAIIRNESISMIEVTSSGFLNSSPIGTVVVSISEPTGLSSIPSKQATASAITLGGELVAATLTQEGVGYSQRPTITVESPSYGLFARVSTAGTALATALGSSTASIDLDGEIEITIPTTPPTILSTATFTLRVHNDLTKGSEIVPT